MHERIPYPSTLLEMTEPIDVRPLMSDAGAGRYPLNPDDIIGVAVHHSVSGGYFFDEIIDTEQQEIDHLVAIDAYHAQQGWNGFGYHLAAFPSGRVYLCGSLTGARAHVASRNDELVGVVLIGDFTSSPPPPAHLLAAREACAYVLRTYPGRAINGHREWALREYPTRCPGNSYLAWVHNLHPLSGEEEDLTPTQAHQLQYVVDISAWLQSWAFPTLIAHIAAARAAAEDDVDAEQLADEIAKESAAVWAAAASAEAKATADEIAARMRE